MSGFLRSSSRTLFSITWPLWAIIALAVVLASCTGGGEQAQLVDPDGAAELDGSGSGELDTATAPDAVSPTAPPADEPDRLAFAGEPHTLRVSVSSLPIVLPSNVVETNVVQVLVTDLLTDGLTRRNPADGSVEPAIADSWTVSPDGLTWTFQLGDATFSNGDGIDADDVIASLTAVATQGSSSVSAPNLWPVIGWVDVGQAAASGDGDVEVVGMTAPASDQVQFELSEPFAALGEVLAGVSFGVVPAESLTDPASAMIGSAVDFVLAEEWTDGLRFSGEQLDGEVSTVELIEDPDFTMFEAGETDLAIGDVAAADRLPDDATPADAQRSATSYFALNAAVAPLDDALIRQAILHAVDAEELLAGQFEDVGPMRSFIPEQVAGGVEDACGSACELDREQALILVEASPNRDVEITIDFWDEFKGVEQPDDGSVLPISFEEQIAESLAEALNDIGLTATPVGHTAEEFAAGVVEGDFGIFRFGSVATALSAESRIGLPFHTDGADNITNTSIARVDELIDEARSTIDDEERASLYASAEQVLFAEAVVLPLMEFRQPFAFSANLESAGLEPDGSLNLAQTAFIEGFADDASAADEPILQGE